MVMMAAVAPESGMSSGAERARPGSHCMWGELSGVRCMRQSRLKREPCFGQRSVMSAVVRAVGRLSEVLLGEGSGQTLENTPRARGQASPSPHCAQKRRLFLGMWGASSSGCSRDAPTVGCFNGRRRNPRPHTSPCIITNVQHRIRHAIPRRASTTSDHHVAVVHGQ